MAKLPKMNLFVDAFNSDTVYLTEEELGLYMRMIFYAWTIIIHIAFVYFFLQSKH